MVSLFIVGYHFFFQTGSHYVLQAVLELTIQTNLQRSAYLCRTSTGIKSMHHYAWMDNNIFKCQKHFSSLSRKVLFLDLSIAWWPADKVTTFDFQGLSKDSHNHVQSQGPGDHHLQGAI